MASSKSPIKGVNLGGWLVLEPWMTPSLFAGTGAVDEYTYCQFATPKQKRALKQFRDTFITEKDFEWLAKQGIQAVRLPVGYWLFGQQGSFLKTYQHVDMVFKWADKYKLQILLDLHGAPGSQNGTMHSGQVGAINWPNQVDKTIDICRQIAERYGRQKALLGISLLNEPSPTIPRAVLQDFYVRARTEMEPLCSPGTWFVMSDNFKPRKWRRRLPNFHMDHHQYQIYTWLDKHLSSRLQLWRAKHLLPRKLARFSRGHRLVIGEWSLVFGERRPELLQRYGEYQMAAFERSADAWFYWNYKTERGGPWNFRDCVERGLLKID